MTARLLAVAEAELAEAVFWYEGQASELGEEFLDEFESVMDRTMAFPVAWKRVGLRDRSPARSSRRLTLEARFPIHGIAARLQIKTAPR